MSLLRSNLPFPIWGATYNGKRADKDVIGGTA
jgi:hypothetical protein